ncbi:MAG: TolC family protein [Planctomycetota bacterium]
MLKAHQTNARWTTGLGLPALLGGLLMVGCQGSIERLDHQVAEMIAERQRLSLGEEGVSDASVGLPKQPSGSGLYDEQPVTTNPAADLLPAKPAPDMQDEVGPAEPETATEPIALDLPALLAYAIEHAPEYRSEKESLFLSTLSLIIERHLWGPRFFNTLSADLSGTPESGDYDTALNLVNDFTVTQRLPYGGTASVSALVNYTNLLQQASTTTSPDETQSSSINASINLPLLRGAGQVAREDLIQAERDLIYAVREFERFRREFFVSISNTYFNLLRQEQGIRNQERQLVGLSRLANQQEAFLGAERISRFEADDAAAQVLFGKSDLAQVIDDYQTSLDALKLRIGMPVEQPLTITGMKIDVPNPALDEAGSIKIGQSARLDLQTDADQVDDARRDVLVARNQLKGDLDLNAGIDLDTDTGRDIDGLDFELGDSDYNVGLEYQAPLDRKIELAQYRSSLVSLERAERDFRVQRDRVALDIRDAIREINRARVTLQLQDENVNLAERRLKSLEIKQNRAQDNIPPRRIIEAEEDLLDARNRRDQSLADLQTSVLNYLLQTGQMRVDGQGRWLAPGKLLPEDQAPSDLLEEEAE